MWPGRGEAGGGRGGEVTRHNRMKLNMIPETCCCRRTGAGKVPDLLQVLMGWSARRKAAVCAHAKTAIGAAQQQDFCVFLCFRQLTPALPCLCPSFQKLLHTFPRKSNLSTLSEASKTEQKNKTKQKKKSTRKLLLPSSPIKMFTPPFLRRSFRAFLIIRCPC